MLLLAKPSEQQIRSFITKQENSSFSYAAVGLSARSAAAPGFDNDHTRVLLGHGEATWHRAVTAIQNWQMFQLGWVHLCWPKAAIAEGSTVAVLMSHLSFWSLNAARIVYVMNENSISMKKYGFAYGTLLDHAESGEERFSVEWHNEDNSVWYDLFAYSRPRATLARLGYPIVRWLQHQFREDSKAAMVRAVNSRD